MDHMFDWTIFSNQSSLRVVVMHVRPPSVHPGFRTLNPDKMQRIPTTKSAIVTRGCRLKACLRKDGGGLLMCTSS